MQSVADSRELLSERALSKLKWRCRRGLLENDLFIARFFERHESRMTVGQAGAMETLMDLSDNDLLDLLLAERSPSPNGPGPRWSHCCSSCAPTARSALQFLLRPESTSESKPK